MSTITPIGMHRFLIAGSGIYRLLNTVDLCGVCRNDGTVIVFDPTDVNGITVSPGAHRLRVECPRCRFDHWNTEHGAPVITDLGPGTDVCATGPLVLVTRPDVDASGVLVVAPGTDCLGCAGTGTVTFYRYNDHEQLGACPICRADTHNTSSRRV